MSEQYAKGKPVKIEFDSADASTAATVNLYDEQGAAYTLGATERLLIGSLALASAAAITAEVYGGTGTSAAAGERILKVFSPANGGQAIQHSFSPIVCKTGVVPKVKGSASGAISVIGVGSVVLA